MFKKQNIFFIILLVAMAVFSGCQKKPVIVSNQIENKISNNNIASTTEDMSTSTENIDMSNWKTYKDKIFNLEFKYPANWQIRTNKDITNGGEEHYLMINDKDTVLFINKLPETISSTTMKNLNDSNKIINNISINNYKSFLATKNDSMRRYWYSYYFKTNNGSYKIYYYPVNLDYNVDITDVVESEKMRVNKIIESIKL